MIERALKLRNFIEDLWDDQVKVYKRSGRSGKDLPLCLQPDSQLTASDWSLLEQMYKLLGKFNVVLRVLEGRPNSRTPASKGKAKAHEIYPDLPAPSSEAGGSDQGLLDVQAHLMALQQAQAQSLTIQ
jgi:hypothetical protein